MVSNQVNYITKSSDQLTVHYLFTQPENSMLCIVIKYYHKTLAVLFNVNIEYFKLTVLSKKDESCTNRL